MSQSGEKCLLASPGSHKETFTEIPEESNHGKPPNEGSGLGCRHG